MINRKIKAIVVDDENRIRRGIERLILSCGEEFEIVGSYSSGTKLMKEYEKENIHLDLLITDIKMPGMNGLELIKEMRKRASFEAVVISGFNDFHYVQTAIRERALDYMVKPLIRDEFRQQLGKIKDKILKNWEEEKKVEIIDTQLRHVKQTQALGKLVRGNEIDLAELEWTKDFPKGTYSLLHISIDFNQKRDISALQSGELEKRIQDILEDLNEATLNLSWIWKGDEASFWILIHNKEADQLQEMMIAEGLHSTIKTGTNLTSTIALSRGFYDVAVIPALRDRLSALLQFRLIYGGNQIYTLSLVENILKERGKIRESKELDITITRMVESLDLLRREELFHHLNHFLNEVKQLRSPQDIEKSIQVLAIQSINRLLTKSSAKDELHLIQEALKLTRKSPNFIELKKNLTTWMQKVLNIFEEMNQHESVNPIDTAKTWITDNLGNNITIDKIAKKVHMNPTYFCEYFKNQTGETVLDFVTKARIEKAKELLLSTDFKIYDISQQVGYNDTKYFSKLFRKYFGEVPSKYKEKAKINLN
ncbi:helix-turn-helix domain-containing protein [Neobacillus cucumis]|uniref:helix-turn-helix domain-containing protein n=1 Tax=Neobacillus cucumis TaxID=1740721 RepID=UPI0019657CEE|nr:helix-turn-helix domain-containing protein [Neobacillus cucumis]MBM7651124.1 two-component system response regulator YesN [Neobacillus cucumis]